MFGNASWIGEPMTVLNVVVLDYLIDQDLPALRQEGVYERNRTEKAPVSRLFIP